MTPTVTIGDFAKASQLSVKTLRHYHDVGLLIPTEIDADSGYRRYSIDQIRAAQIIRRFRDLGMPLAEIGEVLAAPDPAARSEVITAHLHRLEHELAQTQGAVAALRELLEGPTIAATIEHRSEPAMAVASIVQRVELVDLSAWFQGAVGELVGTLAAQDVPVGGPSGAVISDEFFADERGEITVFLPASAPMRAVGRVVPDVLPAVELAVIVHPGSHDDIDRSYGALAEHVARRAISIEGPLRERYLVGRHDTADEARWRTEIGWPIFRADGAA